MTDIARRFTIRWHYDGLDVDSGYKVSIPNFEGGEVVMAEDYDRLAQQHAGAVEALQNLGDPAWARGAGGASMAEYARRTLRELGIEPRGDQ